MKITSGKVVTINYSIRQQDTAEVVEQTDIPIDYVHGGGPQQLIGGLELALEGKEVGDEVDVVVPPEQGFGNYDPDLIFTDDLENAPPQFRHIGAQVEMQNEEGDVKIFHVSKIENGKLTLDGNHPLAGKTAIFHVKVIDVRDATLLEMQNGVEQMPTLQ